jgi:hypothetical protein
MDRLAGKPRVASQAEMGIPGNWNTRADKVGSDYGFGEEVLIAAARELGMDPDDLQAVGWFSEKELWGQNRWTSKLGEGGSFEQMADKDPTRRTTVGLAAGQSDSPPLAETVKQIQQDIDNTLWNEPKVKAYKVKPTIGQYMNDVEESFDIEVSADPDWDGKYLLSEVARHAKKEGQDSAFVSRNITDINASDNARPGAEIYFREKITVEEAQPIIDRLREVDVDGFTFSVDVRDVDGTPNVVGIRYQYVPEFDVMYGGAKIEDLDQIIRDRGDLLDSITSELSGHDNVSHATLTWHDTIVMTDANYEDFISGSQKGNAAKDRKGKVPWGRPVADNVRAATRTAGESAISGGTVPVKPTGEPKGAGQ